MPISKKRQVKKTSSSLLETRVKNTAVKTQALSLSERIQEEIKSNQSYLSLVLGLLIVLVAGILVFNYLKKDQATLGPAQETTEEAQAEDVKAEDLPGKYTVKEGDTLFTISENYYKDGYKFSDIAKANNLTDANAIEVGQVLEIPALAAADTTPALAETATDTTISGEGTGGAVNQTAWGEVITGDTYTVQEGDWLSTISGRAYQGDIMAYDKIAKANNIENPDLIIPGTVLKIPRP